MFEWTTGNAVIACAVFVAMIFCFTLGIRKEMKEKRKG